MVKPKFGTLELTVLKTLWNLGPASVREIQESLPGSKHPAYTTVQTVLYRLEGKKAVRRVKKIGNAHVFEATLSTTAAQRRLVDELLRVFGGRAQPLMSHLIETGQLTLEDIEEARRAVRKRRPKE